MDHATRLRVVAAVEAPREPAAGSPGKGLLHRRALRLRSLKIESMPTPRPLTLLSSLGFAACVACSGPLHALSLVVSPGSGLQANPAALSAFERAAAQWESHFLDDVVVTVQADLSSGLPSNVVGNTSSVRLALPFDEVRNALVADADADDAILAALPTSAGFRALLPAGFSLSGEIEGTKASFKAAGIPGLDQALGPSDGSLLFNAAFPFDFDNRDGVLGSQLDFESVVAHELGHLLGFLSAVDSVDARLALGEGGDVAPTPLDLFRFGALDVPLDATDFASVARNLLPGSNALLDDLGVLSELVSTGASTGDGREASHWRDDRLTRRLIGLMDPTLGFGRVASLSPADVRALDLVGWDTLAVPEPASGALLLLGLAGLGCRRHSPRGR